jgi:hypothetical protein
MRRNFEWRVKESDKNVHYTGTFHQEKEIPLNSLILFPLTLMCLLLRTVWYCSQCLYQTYQFLLSFGRWGCSCIQSFRSSTASLTRLSFRPNSLLTFSSNSLLGNSMTSIDILCMRTQNSVPCSKLFNFSILRHIYFYFQFR